MFAEFEREWEIMKKFLDRSPIFSCIISISDAAVDCAGIDVSVAGGHSKEFCDRTFTGTAWTINRYDLVFSQSHVVSRSPKYP